MTYSVTVQPLYNLLMRRPPIVPLSLLLCLLLAACGQKGPLYLPDPEPVDSKEVTAPDDPEDTKKKSP